MELKNKFKYLLILLSLMINSCIHSPDYSGESLLNPEKREIVQEAKDLKVLLDEWASPSHKVLAYKCRYNVHMDDFSCVVMMDNNIIYQVICTTEKCI